MIILVLLALMSVIVVNNSVVLRQLKHELKLIEQRQLRKSIAPTKITKTQVGTPGSKPSRSPATVVPPPGSSRVD